MKRPLAILAAVLTVLALSGCALRTVEEMYSLPKRSEEYNKLQSAIDNAMAGLEYSAPVAGENRQTLQTADLDGDGREEYLVFAKGDSEKPLQLLIFHQDESGQCTLWESIAMRGSAFEQVQYVYIDNAPGCEIVLSNQVSDQIMGNVSVYTFAQGHAQQLLSTGYTRFTCCDLDMNHHDEILVFRPGEAQMGSGVAVLYNFKNGAMERSVEAQLSVPADGIKRITLSKLYGGTPAAYVASAGKDDRIVTDIFALRDDRFLNVSYISGASGVESVRNYAVFAEDLDDDGAMELPKLISMKPISTLASIQKQYLLRWYSMDLMGNEVDKLCTFHNFAGGWYLLLDSSWASLLTMEQIGSSYTFYMWNEDYNKVTILFTIFEFTGNDREYQASQNNRFVLYREEDVTYAAKLETGSAMFGFTEEFLMNSFRLIKQDG